LAKSQKGEETMNLEQLISILPVLLFIAGSCLFLWLTRERPEMAAKPGRLPPPAPAVPVDAGETVAAIATVLRHAPLPPGRPAADETVAAIAAALRRPR
jgi:hypothetical protein